MLTLEHLKMLTTLNTDFTLVNEAGGEDKLQPRSLKWNLDKCSTPYGSRTEKILSECLPEIIMCSYCFSFDASCLLELNLKG